MTTPDFALNDSALLRSGECGTIVALPADVKAAGGPPGSYRVKLDNAARGWEYHLPQTLTRVEQEATPMNAKQAYEAAKATVAELRAENERYRDALFVIASNNTDNYRQTAYDALHPPAPARGSEQETTP